MDVIGKRIYVYFDIFLVSLISETKKVCLVVLPLNYKISFYKKTNKTNYLFNNYTLKISNQI